MTDKTNLIETRPGHALCWPPRQPRPGGPDYIGVVPVRGPEMVGPCDHAKSRGRAALRSRVAAAEGIEAEGPETRCPGLQIGKKKEIRLRAAEFFSKFHPLSRLAGHPAASNAWAESGAGLGKAKGRRRRRS